MDKYTIPLEPDKYYHIYNHAVSKDNLFKTDENYFFFLKKYAQYITSVADTFAYCLMPNHFHFAIRIKPEKEIKTDLPGFENLAGLVSQQFSNLFNSYSRAFNKQQNRRGTLFEKPFKRIHITNEKYFKTLIHYIHYNPVNHDFTDNIKKWKFSSYNSFFTDKATLLKREEVFDLFGDKQNFYFFHKNDIDYNDDIILD